MCYRFTKNVCWHLISRFLTAANNDEHMWCRIHADDVVQSLFHMPCDHQNHGIDIIIILAAQNFEIWICSSILIVPDSIHAIDLVRLVNTLDMMSRNFCLYLNLLWWCCYSWKWLVRVWLSSRCRYRRQLVEVMTSNRSFACTIEWIW